MLLPQLVAIAVLQGFTEFLPISSSGHLILLPHLTGWPDHGLDYDVAAHFGTLLAVIGYFHRDLVQMSRHWLRHVSGGPATEHSRLAWAVLWGTLPVCVVGFLARDLISEYLRSPLVIAATTIGFGVVLWISDVVGRRERNTTSMSWADIATIGFAQCLALIPGTSRSGITISAGLALGLTRTSAARFSFLLSVPVIFLATAYELLHLSRVAVVVDWVALVAVAFGACLSAFICIALFLRLLDRIGMLPFVLYRFALGAVLLVLYL